MLLRYVGVLFGSLLWTAIVFFVAVDLGFPSDAAKSWLRYQLESKTKDQWSFDAADIDMWRLTGVTAKDLVVYKVARKIRSADDEPTPATTFLHLDRFSARVEILPLLATLGRARRLDYQATFFGNEIDGVVGTTGTVTQVLAETDALDLSKLPTSGETWSVALTGKSHLDIDLEVDREDVEKSRGHIKLEVDDLVLTDGEALGSKFSEIASDIFPAAFSEAILAFDVKDGKAEVTKGSFISEPLEAEVSGDIQLRKELSRSKLNLQISLRLNESLDKLARLAPMLSSSRDGEGVYHVALTGTVMSPRFREERTSSGRSSASTRNTRQSGGAEGTGGGATAEERQKAREERLEKIKERRERMRSGSGAAGMPGVPPQQPEPGMGNEEPLPFDEEGHGPMGLEEEGPEAAFRDEEPPEPPPDMEEPNEQPYIEQ